MQISDVIPIIGTDTKPIYKIIVYDLHGNKLGEFELPNPEDAEEFKEFLKENLLQPYETHRLQKSSGQI